VSIQLEDLIARVRLDTSGVGQGLGEVQSSLSRAGAGLSSAGRKMSLGITAPLAGIAVAGVNMAADFDLTMRKVAIATGGPTKALSELAMQMGAETAFSASEASGAMLELAKGGMTAAEIQAGALEQTMRLASAGDVALGDSATYVANAMNTFGLKAKDADDITTALAGAANASSASVESLGQGLSQGALAAKNAGLNLQETVGVLSLFDANALKGSDAGTSLKAAMNSLIPTTTKAKNAMADANLDFVDAQGNFVGVADMADQLHKRLGPLSQAQRQLALETIFGSDGMRAATILMEQGRAGVEKYTKAARDEATTTKLADAAMSGLSGSIERAKGSLETAALTIGLVLAPYVERAAGFVERLANMFTNLPGPVQGMVVAGGALLAVLGPILVAMGMVVSAIGALVPAAAAAAPAVAGAGGAVAAATIPLWAILAALAAVGVGLVVLYQRSSTFRAVVQSSMAQAQAAFAGLRAVVVPIINQIVGVVRSQMPQIRATIQSVFGSLKSIVSSAMSIVTSVVRIATTVIRTVWQAAGQNILNVIRIAMTTVMGVIRGAMQIIQGIFQTVAAVLRGDWQGAWDGIKQILKGAMTVLVALVKGGFQLVVEGVKIGVKLAVAAVKALPGLIKGALTGLGTLLFSAGQDILEGLINGIESMIGAVKSKLSSITGLIPDWKGPESVDKSLLYQSGRWIIQGLNRGLGDEAKKTEIVLRGITRGLFDGIAESIGPVQSDVQQDIGDLLARIEKEYTDQGDAAQKRIERKFQQREKDLQRALKQSKKTDTKADDKANQEALDALDGQQERAIKRMRRRYAEMAASARAAIKTVTAALSENARQQDVLQVNLDAAMDKLRELQGVAASFAEGVTKSFADYGNVVGLGVRKVGEDTTVTITDLLADMRDRVSKAAEFSRLITTLTAQGLNSSTIQSLLTAGVEGGLATAQAIASGGAEGIATINTLSAELTSQGATLGSNLAAQFYGSGINAAQAVVDGLVVDQAALVAQADRLENDLRVALGDKAHKSGKDTGRAAMDGLVEGLSNHGEVTHAGRQVAKALVRAFREELGIHSPSRVFGGLADMTIGGYVGRIQRLLGTVSAAGQSIAAATVFTPPVLSAPRVGVPGVPGSPTGSQFGGTAPVTVLVTIGNEKVDAHVETVVGRTLAPLRTAARTGGI
jgi:TP901 family phage tail tape measure protein